MSMKNGRIYATIEEKLSCHENKKTVGICEREGDSIMNQFLNPVMKVKLKKSLSNHQSSQRTKQ